MLKTMIKNQGLFKILIHAIMAHLLKILPKFEVYWSTKYWDSVSHTKKCDFQKNSIKVFPISSIKICLLTINPIV